MSGENGKAKSVQPGSGEMRNIPMRRSGIRIMGRLVGLVTPLLPVMLLAILLGTLGYLCAIFLTILAGFGLLHILLVAAGGDSGASPGDGAGDTFCPPHCPGGGQGRAPLRGAVLQPFYRL